MMAIPAMKFIMDVVLHLPYGVAGAEESCAMRFFSVLLSLLVCIFILSGCSPEPQLLQPTDSLLNEIESVSYQFSELLPGMTKDEVMKALSLSEDDIVVVTGSTKERIHFPISVPLNVFSDYEWDAILYFEDGHYLRTQLSSSIFDISTDEANDMAVYIYDSLKLMYPDAEVYSSQQSSEQVELPLIDTLGSNISLQFFEDHVSLIAMTASYQDRSQSNAVDYENEFSFSLHF